MLLINDSVDAKQVWRGSIVQIAHRRYPRICWPFIIIRFPLIPIPSFPYHRRIEHTAAKIKKSVLFEI